jgi:hypothetical protein
MKKIIAIACLLAFTGGAFAVNVASVSNTETAIIVKSLDKDKDKKKKKGEKACCSKDAAKSCGESGHGKAAAESGNGAAKSDAKPAGKPCCASKADGAKGCGGGAGEKPSAPTGK